LIALGMGGTGAGDHIPSSSQRSTLNQARRKLVQNCRSGAASFCGDGLPSEGRVVRPLRAMRRPAARG
jgi:hypothetical protein